MRHKHSVTDSPGQLASIAALSAAIGAVVAMLFTPRSGKEVRGDLKRRAEHLKEDVQHKLEVETIEVDDTAKDDVAKNVTERVKSTVAKVADDAKTTAAKVKTDAVKTKTETKSAVKTSKPE